MPLTVDQKYQQQKRTGAGQYARRLAGDTFRSQLIEVKRAEALATNDERAVWLDSMYDQIEARVKMEVEYPADDLGSDPGLMVGDRFRIQLDKPITVFIRRVYCTGIVENSVAKCRHRIRFGVFGAPDNGEGKQATIGGFTVAQFRALNPISLDQIVDNDCPWAAY